MQKLHSSTMKSQMLEYWRVSTFKCSIAKTLATWRVALTDSVLASDSCSRHGPAALSASACASDASLRSPGSKGKVARTALIDVATSPRLDVGERHTEHDESSTPALALPDGRR